jgi:hypothetical protein
MKDPGVGVAAMGDRSSVIQSSFQPIKETRTDDRIAHLYLHQGNPSAACLFEHRSCPSSSGISYDHLSPPP